MPGVGVKTLSSQARGRDALACKSAPGRAGNTWLRRGIPNGALPKLASYVRQPEPVVGLHVPASRPEVQHCWPDPQEVLVHTHLPPTQSGVVPEHAGVHVGVGAASHAPPWHTIPAPHWASVVHASHWPPTHT